MSKKPKRTAVPRHTTQPRDINRWLDRAARQLVAADYPGVIATAGRVLRAPIASPQQVLAEVANRTSGFTMGSLAAAALLGYAHLLEGKIERAMAWAAGAVRSPAAPPWRPSARYAWAPAWQTAPARHTRVAATDM
jgi:hypothetical protein